MAGLEAPKAERTPACKPDVDVIIVGAGIAGASLAAVLARGGIRVAVLERQTVYRDRVRGELLQPWGVAEARRLGLASVLEAAGGVIPRWNVLVLYDESRTPADARTVRRDMRDVFPGIGGPLCIGHPAACQALVESADSAGAQVIRGVNHLRITSGTRPEVRFEQAGVEHCLSARLVVGADGRNSVVRPQLDVAVRRTAPTHLVAGMLVDGVPDWPQDSYSAGTQRDVMYFVIPRGGERLRLYFCTAHDQPERFAGSAGPRHFLETFRSLPAVPHSDAIANGTPIGPCATFTAENVWADSPLLQGVALIGDAAGYIDPITAQGLSIALRDVRILSELLLGSADWSIASLLPYAHERRERIRRLRFTADLLPALTTEFGPEANARRKRFNDRLRDGTHPELKWALASTHVGPDNVPAFAFEDAMRRAVLQ